MKKIDIQGEKFNKWTAIKYAGNSSWLCQCECGTISKVGGQNLRQFKSIGCFKCAIKKRTGIPRNDYSGLKINKWTILKFISSHKYEASCDCGRIWVVNANNIISGKSKSCRACGNISLRKHESNINRMFVEYQRGAKDRNLLFELTKEEFANILKQDCFYCGKTVTEIPITKTIQGKYGEPFYYNGIDRIDNNEGYTEENTVTCCFVCNRAKRELPIELFMQWIDRIKYSIDKKIEYH